MTMDQLYEEMKEVLRFFGLAFNQKDQVTVTFEANKVHFKYKNMTVSIDGKPEE